MHRDVCSPLQGPTAGGGSAASHQPGDRAALGFAYNLGYAVFGGLTPLLVVMLVKQHPMGAGYYVMLLALIGSVIGAGLWRRSPAQAHHPTHSA